MPKQVAIKPRHRDGRRPANRTYAWKKAHGLFKDRTPKNPRKPKVVEPVLEPQEDVVPVQAPDIPIPVEKPVVESPMKPSEVLGDGLHKLDVSPLVLFIITYLAARHLPVDCAKVHLTLCDALGKLGGSSKMAIDLARGFAKSTYASKFWPLYLIMEGKYPEIQMIGQTGGSAGVATRNLTWIKNELETNLLLQSDYKFKRGRAWGQDHIQVIRSDGSKVDVYSRGKGCAIRGSRGIIICDDLQDQTDVESETVLAADELWFFSDVVPILVPGQPLVMIGSALSPLSLLSKCKVHPQFHVLEFPALDDTGRSIWEQGRSTEWLLEQKALMGDDLFNANYMCKPLVSGNPVFRREWFRYYEKGTAFYDKLRANGLHTIVAMDAAFSLRKGADYTAVVTLGMTRETNPRAYVMDVFRGQVTIPSAAEWLYSQAAQYNANLVFIETEKVNPPEDNDVMLLEFKRVMEQHGRRFTLDWEHPKQDKVSRAFAVQGMFQSGRVFFDKSDKNQIMLMNELEMFTGDKKYHDDMVDAIVHGLRRGLVAKSKNSKPLYNPESRRGFQDEFTGWG